MKELIKQFLECLPSTAEDTIIMKVAYKQEEQQLFYAVVLEPMTDVTPEGDTHGHRMSAAEVEAAAHNYMLKGAKVKRMHEKPAEVKVVESYISPVDWVPEGGVMITKGSWVMTVKVFDKAIWKEIKDGELKAFSPGGLGKLKDL